jgi:hypothetical protein
MQVRMHRAREPPVGLLDLGHVGTGR